MATLLSAIGEPAGGSLTVDQRMLMATVFGPVMVSIELSVTTPIFC